MIAVRLVIGALVAWFGGRALARALFALPSEAAWFTGTIKAGLRAIERPDLANADDIQTIGSIILLVGCVAAVGLLVVGIDYLIFRSRPARS